MSNPNLQLTLADYALLDTSAYHLNSHKIRSEIDRMLEADSDSLLADYRTRSYYIRRGSLVWIDRMGLDDRADTLLHSLHEISRLGFSPQRFRLPQIEADLQRVRRLDFDDDANTINKVMGRLEYNLTKAYLRYVTGQRFGYVNPAYLLNHQDIHEQDSAHKSYRTLYALKSHKPDAAFYELAFHEVHVDSIAGFLHQVEPQGSYYHRLLNLLNGDSASFYGRRLLMVNIERCRWRLDDYPQQHGKYVLVNIPSFQLRAVSPGKVITMRVGCGTLETKTPLLSSEIKRMDINPQWIMPRSIIRKSIIPRLGDVAFFKSRHYFIRERSTGKNVSLERVTPAMLESGNYLAIQEGGAGNSLGRIIFRFDNDFSIYLHDTSSKDVFSKEDRGVSHGCVRVQHPFELAAFLIGDNHSGKLARIRYSMNADVSSLGQGKGELTDEQLARADTLRRDMLIGRVEVKPAVPVYIVYYTLYPDPDGRIQRFDDVYGYDKLIYHFLGNYM